LHHRRGCFLPKSSGDAGQIAHQLNEEGNNVSDEEVEDKNAE
jgi:hypothetical protein